MEIGNSKTVGEREEEGVTIDVKDAKGDREPGVTITVVGSYSDTYRKLQNKNRDSMLKKRGRLEGDELEGQSVETTARCIKSWAGFTSSGKEFPYTTANAVALLTSCPWIREQVEEAIHDHAAFFPKPLAA